MIYNDIYAIQCDSDNEYVIIRPDCVLKNYVIYH